MCHYDTFCLFSLHALKGCTHRFFSASIKSEISLSNCLKNVLNIQKQMDKLIEIHRRIFLVLQLVLQRIFKECVIFLVLVYMLHGILCSPTMTRQYTSQDLWAIRLSHPGLKLQDMLTFSKLKEVDIMKPRRVCKAGKKKTTNN